MVITIILLPDVEWMSYGMHVLREYVRIEDNSSLTFLFEFFFFFEFLCFEFQCDVYLSKE